MHFTTQTYEMMLLISMSLITVNFVAKPRFSVKYLILYSIVLSKNERYFLKINKSPSGVVSNSGLLAFLKDLITF
ncbi:Uncharacterized protein GNX_3235 [Leptospira interrogans serovar Canicola]|nr:Uncharacterized protein GNX_3235 [Leptospira interrogans serovar Canicola]